jgi:hypothetical protein
LETANVFLQIFMTFWLTALPVGAILWFTSGVILNRENAIYGANLGLIPTFFQTVLPLAFYAFVTTWLTVVVTSVLGCLFIRFTAGSPGLYPSRGLKGALLMYRMNKMNTIQKQWTWTLTGQYLRALAGVRFPRVGASECDIMFNLVPELASVDSHVFWSSGCLTNMLDYGAEHIKLRQLDMPRNFFTGNNCVAENGHFPANFLLGVSTPCNDIQFRRQMRSWPGEPITVAGNPPVKFASASFEEENEKIRQPRFSIFLTRVFLNDLFSIGILPSTEAAIFAILYICFSRSGGHPIISAVMALLLTQVGLVLLSIAVKKLFVGKWGVDHSTPFWSWQHFAYFFAQDCFFVWCREPLRLFAGTTVPNYILRWMGCKIGPRTIVSQPMQCFDWNAVDFGSDCFVEGLLQFHTFENMVLKVKRTHIEDGCTVNAGATVMGGAVMEPDTTLLPLSLVLKEINLSPGTYGGSPAEAVTNSTSDLAVPAPDVTHEASIPRAVDNTDWLKTVAIILVLVDHFGYFFMDNDHWWGAFGRMAAPTFFFLLGYSRTSRVPLQWIVLGVGLTLLDSSNNDWTWMPPNILLSFALIRLASPYVRTFVERRGWVAYATVALALVAVLPLAAMVVDYGAEGWLWALFGLSQRMYVDGKAVVGVKEAAQNLATQAYARINNAGLMRLLICVVTAVVYVWQEQLEFKFSQGQLAIFIVGLGILCLSLCLFLRGPSRVQPPESVASVLRFIGRHTLEIYAIELIVFELIAEWLPDLTP